MERKSLSRNLKYHSLGMVHYHHHNHPSWDNCSSECNESINTSQDLVGGGFSWPPRSYSCGFCRREFRSAQALGGHMNVHRRDRARLRQSPPPPPPPPPKENHYMVNLNLHPNPNPNPNPNTSFASSSLPSQCCSEIKKCSGDGSTVDLAKMKKGKTLFRVGEPESFARETKGCLVRLDLEIGLGKDSKEDLDLELRLGYS
ncbi:hypothetical protein LguiA_001228 [Lonicera macranthoides]